VHRGSLLNLDEKEGNEHHDKRMEALLKKLVSFNKVIADIDVNKNYSLKLDEGKGDVRYNSELIKDGKDISKYNRATIQFMKNAGLYGNDIMASNEKSDECLINEKVFEEKGYRLM
jgi:hypothetical protein